MLLLVTDHHGSLHRILILLLRRSRRSRRWLLEHLVVVMVLMLAKHETPGSLNPILRLLLLLLWLAPRVPPQHDVLVEGAGLRLESAAPRGSLIQRYRGLFLVLGQDVLQTGSRGGTPACVIRLEFAIIESSARDYRSTVIFEVIIDV